MNDHEKSYRYAVEHLAAVRVMRERAGELPIDFTRLHADVKAKAKEMANCTFMPSTSTTLNDAYDALMRAAGVIPPSEFEPLHTFFATLLHHAAPDGVVETDEEGYIVEGAHQQGFEPIDDNGDLLVVHANDLIKYVMAQREAVAAPPRFAYPQGLTEDLQFILGLPIFQTAPMAHVFRKAGAIIPTKVEAEQAFVLDKMMRTLLTYPATWRAEFDHSLKLAQEECQRLDDAVLVGKVANRLDQ